MIQVGNAGDKGRGVFAQRRIAQGEVIECVPVIVLSDPQWQIIEQTTLKDYYYAWGDGIALALGFAALYNHSYTPNAVYIKHIEEQTVEFVALRDIEAGEEITVNYNGRPDDLSPVWFTPVL